MTISDADFTAWLAKDAARVVLAEMAFAYESVGAPAEGTVYFANRPFATRPTDTPASTRYRDAISALPSISRRVNPDSLGGITEVSVGKLELDNADGELDFLLDLIVDGREVRFYLGDQSWPRSDFRLVQIALSEVVEAPGDDRVEVLLRDQRLLLDKAIAGDVVNDERRKPIVVGYAAGGYSIEPVEKSAANLEYYVLQNYADGAASAVRDNGVDLSSGIIFAADETQLTVNAGTDTLTKTGHGLAVNDVVDFVASLGSFFLQGISQGTQYWVISAGLTADDFRLSTTKGGSAVNLSAHSGTGTVDVTRKRYFDNVDVDGTITLSSTPSGRITVDVVGFLPSQSTVDGGVGELVRALLVDYGGIDSADIETSTFRTADSAITANDQLCGRVVTERENLLDVLDDVARVTQICYGPDHEGTWHAFRLNLSGLSAATPTRALTASDLFGEPVVRNARVITGTVAVRSRKNERPLSYGELAASVSVADKRTYSGQFRDVRESTAPSGTAYSGNWQGFYRTAVRREVEGAFAATGANITSIADEILGDLVPHVRAIEVETDLRPYEWRLGDVVLFTYPRYGFDAGVNCRVVDIQSDLVNGACKLKLLTKVSPDYTTASYP